MKLFVHSEICGGMWVMLYTFACWFYLLGELFLKKISPPPVFRQKNISALSSLATIVLLARIYMTPLAFCINRLIKAFPHRIN